MKDEILREKLKKLSKKQMAWINTYMKDDMRKLKKITYHTFKGFNIPNSEHDELYDKAMDVLMESAVSYDENNEANFNTFLIGNIKRKVSTWYRDNYQRGKRKNLLRDKKGNIVYEIDSNGKKTPVIISDISFDTPALDDDVDLKEKIASNFNIENESNLNFQANDNIEKFMASLSNKQRIILKMKMQDISSDEIKQQLSISDKEYNSVMQSIKMNENLTLFTKNKREFIEEENVMEERVMEIKEAEGYRMDKYSIFSLIDMKKTGDINCKYILQRKPFQWSNEERNRYICRLLSNLPIPEIILCEQNVKGMTISHLIDGLQRLSYAESFKENHFKIGSKGAERHLIQYREYVLDENGNRVLDEDGIPIFELRVIDVVGKSYKDLPDELKKRFNNFNVNVTKFFNCTDDQIADHIRDYNNHASMNKEQSGMTIISTETARKIKTITEKTGFFKNCGKYTPSNWTKGKIDRMVAEMVMLFFHSDNWKSDVRMAYKYLDENASQEEFDVVKSDLDKLETVLEHAGDNVNTMFTTTYTPMWMAVFHKFLTYNIGLNKFIDFLNAYNNGLKNTKINGINMDDFKDHQSKNKATITGKVELLIQLMNDYLHIEETENEECKSEVENNIVETAEDDTLEFVKANVNPDATENDIDECYELIDYAKNKLHGFNKESAILDYHNENALIAIFAYALKNDIDLDQWLVKVSNQNNVYSENQKENYTYMINSLNNYVQASA